MSATGFNKLFRFCPFLLIIFAANVSLAEDKKNEDPVEIFARAEIALKRTDVKEGLMLLHQAAEMNYTPAQVYLAEYLDLSEYDDEAVGWFMTAAFQGNPAGAFGLAKMYSAGEGIAQSDEKALYWFRFAAERNHRGAAKVLIATYKLGKLGQQKNLEQAKVWEDKLPALEAAEAKENARKRKLAIKAAEEEKEKLKADLESKKKKVIEEQELKESTVTPSSDGADSK